jgi:hypothetical protein
MSFQKLLPKYDRDIWVSSLTTGSLRMFHISIFQFTFHKMATLHTYKTCNNSQGMTDEYEEKKYEPT